jgi:tetratricopeptide (TPR) repeat protein
LDAALQLMPDLLPALFQRAHLHLSLGEHEAARRDFDAILKQSPDFAPAFIGRSVAWEQAGNLEQSENDFGEATQAAPQDAENLELARLLLNASAAHSSQQFEKAVAYATEAIQQDPENLQAYQIRAVAYWYSEQFVEAVDDFSHLVQSADDADRGYYSGRGQVYAELGEYDKALEDLDRAVAMARENGPSAALAYSLNGRGRALTGLGRSEDAERDFAESLQLKPDNAWLHFNRGLFYLENGQTENAAACFDLSLHVSSPPLTPRKQSRASGFLKKIAQSQRSEDEEEI